ncbi:MAG: nitrilase-related carbon-nitrogen hydrolase, partial [Brevinematales bacterium]
MISRFFKNRYSIIPVIIASGACYFFSAGLQGNFWYLLWIAPIPVLVYSYYNTKTAAFFAAFFAFGLSKIDMIGYLLKVMTPAAAAEAILFFSIAFALIILLNKVLSSRLEGSAPIFVFPVLYTAFEFIAGLFLPNGTFGSIAYTQSDFLPVIQIASITGMYGITFFICLAASFASSLIIIKESKISLSSFIFPLIILLSVPVYGILRIRNFTAGTAAGAGNFSALCIKVDSNAPGVLQEYTNLIQLNAGEKTGCILLPEKILEIGVGEKTNFYPELLSLAKKKDSMIVAGFKVKNGHYENIAAVFFPDGKTVLEYEKKYLVPGWEKDFERGDRPLIFKYSQFNIGAAICKDMDFPRWIRKYSSADIMVVPAWDFQTDNWMHSRMAILRCVEDGFTMIRSAREGDLTITGPL